MDKKRLTIEVTVVYDAYDLPKGYGSPQLADAIRQQVFEAVRWMGPVEPIFTYLAPKADRK